MRERGAAAVEFALVLPLLLSILLGIVDFGHRWHVKLTAVDAAKQGVRTAVLTDPAGDPAAAARAMVREASGWSGLPDDQIAVTPCTGANERAEVVVTYAFGATPLDLFLGGTLSDTTTGRGVMECPA